VSSKPEILSEVEPLAAPIVDTHCHMDVSYSSEEPALSPTEALANAHRVGIEKVIQVGCDVPSSVWAAQAALTYENVWAAVAIHPNDAARDPELSKSIEEIARLAQLPQVRAIGETGLDYFRTSAELHAKQQESFRAHIDIARANNKALVIHDRDAHDDVINTLLSYGAPDKVVFHCYSGDATMAKICAEHGWYMSFAGPVTFPKNTDLQEAATIAPLELLLVETDAPFLTPAPHRGQANSSALLPHTVRAIAKLRKLDEAQLCKALYQNAETVFGPL
jgi:TatD DNase family protein